MRQPADLDQILKSAITNLKGIPLYYYINKLSKY